MLITCRYRSLTKRRDHERLAALLETQRVLYNAALAERRYAYRMAGKSLTECRLA